MKNKKKKKILCNEHKDVVTFSCKIICMFKMLKFDSHNFISFSMRSLTFIRVYESMSIYFFLIFSFLFNFISFSLLYVNVQSAECWMLSAECATFFYSSVFPKTFNLFIFYGNICCSIAFLGKKLFLFLFIISFIQNSQLFPSLDITASNKIVFRMLLKFLAFKRRKQISKSTNLCVLLTIFAMVDLSFSILAFS